MATGSRTPFARPAPRPAQSRTVVLKGQRLPAEACSDPVPLFTSPASGILLSTGVHQRGGLPSLLAGRC
jgi:hypothetical protein